MEIIIDKINSEPNHSISKKDISVILKIIPKEWIGVCHIFKIASQKFENSRWDRPVILNNTTFNILSRGIEKNVIIKELLIELAINPTKNYPFYGHKLTKEQRRKLEEVIEPYYKAIIEEIDKS